jgi:hypothetical protein
MVSASESQKFTSMSSKRAPESPNHRITRKRLACIISHVSPNRTLPLSMNERTMFHLQLKQLNHHHHTMFPQRTMLRTSQRFASQLRSPAVRTPFQRRFASTESSGFVGAEDNAFNRERKAVKDHAAATSGTHS